MKEIEGSIQIQYLDQDAEREIEIAPGFSEGTEALLRYAFESGDIEKLDPKIGYRLRLYVEMNVSTTYVAKQANVSRSTAHLTLLRAIGNLWELVPDSFRERYARHEVVKLKNPNVVKTGKNYLTTEVRSRIGASKGPMTEEQKQHLRDLMTPEERTRRKQISKAWSKKHPLSDEAKKKLKEGQNRYLERRRLLRRLDKDFRKLLKKRSNQGRKPRDYKHEYQLQLARKARNPEAVSQKRKRETRDYAAERERRKERLGLSVSESARQKRLDITVEERLTDLLKGALRNLKFLETELPEEVRQAFIANQDLKAEWKTVHSKIGDYPYFMYKGGVLCYVIPAEERNIVYIVTDGLLTTLWNNGNIFTPGDRTNVSYFGKLTIEELGSTLHSIAQSPQKGRSQG